MQSLHIAFLGCGFITRVHSRHLRTLRSDIVCSYASRERAKAEQFRRTFDGQRSYGSYEEAMSDPGVDAVGFTVTFVAVGPAKNVPLTVLRM